MDLDSNRRGAWGGAAGARAGRCARGRRGAEQLHRHVQRRASEAVGDLVPRCCSPASLTVVAAGRRRTPTEQGRTFQPRTTCRAASQTPPLRTRVVCPLLLGQLSLRRYPATMDPPELDGRSSQGHRGNPSSRCGGWLDQLSDPDNQDDLCRPPRTAASRVKLLQRSQAGGGRGPVRSARYPNVRAEHRLHSPAPSRGSAALRALLPTAVHARRCLGLARCVALSGREDSPSRRPRGIDDVGDAARGGPSSTPPRRRTRAAEALAVLVADEAGTQARARPRKVLAPS